MLNNKGYLIINAVKPERVLTRADYRRKRRHARHYPEWKECPDIRKVDHTTELTIDYGTSKGLTNGAFYHSDMK